jgi:hypothetical protein
MLRFGTLLLRKTGYSKKREVDNFTVAVGVSEPTYSHWRMTSAPPVVLAPPEHRILRVAEIPARHALYRLTVFGNEDFDSVFCESILLQASDV